MGFADSNTNTIYEPSFFKGLKYRCIGPSRGGRVTTVTGIASQPSVFYMGATGGGVWKTTDYGRNWVNVSDGYFETGSIGAIQVADSDTNIIYVGTGSDGIRSNVIAGRGVYKSEDAGKTWKFLGLRDVGQIGAVEVHPENPDIVFVAAIGNVFGPSPERGVYRTVDGGNTWDKVMFLSDKTGAVDLELCPNNPDEIYASFWRCERKPWTIISGADEGGLFKSSDGGTTWIHLMEGLPQDLIGKSDLAVSAADPDRIYILMEAAPGGGLYRSDDRGQSFELVSDKIELVNRPFYYTNLDADPTNADILYVNTGRFWKSQDAGKTWESRSTPHGDNHDMWINPQNPNIFIQSNDGGTNVTLDGGNTWSTQFNQPTAELYQVDIDDQFPYWVYAGQQDNSTIAVPSLPPSPSPAGPLGYWISIGGCETGPAVPKPGDHNIVYANCKGRFGRYNKKTGQEMQFYVGAANMYSHNPKDLKYRFQRVSPIHVSPHDPEVVYHASQYVHRTTDGGVTWDTISPDLTEFDPSKQVISGSPITRDITGEEFYSTIYAVRESPLEKGLIWVGANDGPIHVTRDGGRTWSNVTPKDLPWGGRVQTVEPSPHRANKAYVAVHRYLLNDWQPFIYRTEDYGQTWTRLTTGQNGVPEDYPTRVVREDPDREGLLYAGTEFGMFISFDDGAHWQSFQLNLPVTPVTDIKVHQKDLVLSTMGRSFWILDNVTPLHQLGENVAKAPSHLYPPCDAYRMHFRSRSFRGSVRVPEYLQPGVMIDYYFAEKPDDVVMLEIRDANGNLIRSFTSEKQDIQLEGLAFEDLVEAMKRFGGPLLPKNPEMNRFFWDMRHAGAWNERAGRRMGGPVVSPGTYQAKLTIGNWTQTERFRVLVDPRVTEDGITHADLVAQESLSLQVRDTLSMANWVVERIRKARESAEVNRKNKEKLSSLYAKFVTATGPYPQPMLIDQLSYLSSMLNRADQKPGRDAYVRFDELNQELFANVMEVNKILGNK
ncbi:MAG: hypothetical protein JSV17_01965 [Candidatus Aminicenantes bacterium]|nr:MAG: hypothetical protein JSV17_01965 [Candidatus Aminicenantes bacterium]